MYFYNKHNMYYCNKHMDNDTKFRENFNKHITDFKKENIKPNIIIYTTLLFFITILIIQIRLIYNTL